jgi:hypothetical protein
MTPEPASNIGLVCPLHAPKPNPILAAMDPRAFLGQYVKIAFPCLSCTPVQYEHMWVHVTRVLKGGTLLGTLANDPVHQVGARYDSTVIVDTAEIEALDVPER